MITFIFVTALVLGTLCLSALYTSCAEWTLHRYIMHRPFWFFSYPYKTHACTHHRVFKWDHTYHLQREQDKWTIPMAWWNGPALVALTCALPLVPLWILGTHWLTALIMTLTLVLFVSAYYGVYEYLHWCMHLPLSKRRKVERWPIICLIFRRLNGHHLLHHRYMHKNFNVVLPLADWLFGTLLPRATIRFAQATGVSMPNVQPLNIQPI